MKYYYVKRINKDELSHHGIPGMRWGRRKGPIDKASTNKKGSKVDIEARKDKGRKVVKGLAIMGATAATVAVVGPPVAAFWMFRNANR